MSYLFVLQSILAVMLEVAPWLLLGLTVAGLLKALLPESLLPRRLLHPA